MAANVLDKLLETLDVRLHAFAICHIEHGYRLVFDPMDAVVIHYVLAGAGVLKVGNAAPVPFGPRSILVVPPRQSQSLSPNVGSLRDVLASESSILVADGLIKFIAGPGEGEILTVCGTISATYSGAFGLFDHLTGPMVESSTDEPRLRTTFDALLAELAEPGIGTRALTEALMKQGLVLLLRQHIERDGIESPLFSVLRDHRLARAVAAIVKSPNARHTLDDLAAIAGMSRTSFAERFSQAFGRTALEFVQRARLHHAAHLLGTTDLPVKVVANSVGYASRSHFSRAFRDAYDTDPKTYRSLKSVADEPAPPEALRPSAEGPFL